MDVITANPLWLKNTFAVPVGLCKQEVLRNFFNIGFSWLTFFLFFRSKKNLVCIGLLSLARDIQGAVALAYWIRL